MNEQEALPYYKIFEDATGIKVVYTRASDTALFSRILIEHRARQRTWDLVVTTPVNRLPDEVLLQFETPQVKELIPQAHGPNKRWYGVYSNYNTPAYNTNLVKQADLPKTYEEFLDPQGMGRPGRDRQERHRMAEHAVRALWRAARPQARAGHGHDAQADPHRRATCCSRARSAPASTRWR